jgi:hypothetical protein
MRFLKWLIPLLVFGFIGYAVLTSWRNWIVTEPRPKPAMTWGDVRVKVLNASGVPGAGRDVAEYLSRAGLDVYGDSNYYEIIPRTRIIDRRDPQMKYAREIRNAVLVPARKLGPFTVQPRLEPEIGSAIDSLLYLECTVVLGINYRTFLPVSSRPF